MLKTKHTIFYSIERTIKRYRKYAQAKINQEIPKITLDQSMLIKELIDKPDATQSDVAEFIFKDVASVTRMVELLVKKEIIIRIENPNNRRQNKLTVTKEGIEMMDKITEIVKTNRLTALEGISEEEISSCRTTLDKIFNNLKR